MTDIEIVAELDRAVTRERESTRAILEFLNLAEDRRLYLLDDCKDLFTWLVRRFKYSQGSACRRKQAATMLREMPELGALLDSGELNLTSLNKAAGAFAAERKRTGEAVPVAKKREVLERARGKCGVELERILVESFPEQKPKRRRDSLQLLANGNSLLTVELTPEGRAAFERSRELLSHAMPRATWSDLANRVATDWVRWEDPLAKEITAPRSLRVTTGIVPKRLRTYVLVRDGGACVICKSRYMVEVDHIVPRALGGTNEVENLRTLCRRHNQLAAEETLGKKWANAWREGAAQRR